MIKEHSKDNKKMQLSTCKIIHGIKYCYLNSSLHREDGPAVEYADGHKEWWLCNKKYYSEEEYYRYLNLIAFL